MSLMNSMLVSAAAIAAAPSVAPAVSASDSGLALFAAARLVLADLERGRAIDAHALRWHDHVRGQLAPTWRPRRAQGRNPMQKQRARLMVQPQSRPRRPTSSS